MHAPWILGVLALSAMVSSPAAASTINTNLTTAFNLLGSFDAAIDADVAPDAAVAAKRLFNSRLGDWQGTTSTLQYVHSYTFSLNDPGVLVAPAVNRPLLQVDTQASLSGALVGATAASSGFSSPWSCPAGQLKCSSGVVGETKPSVTVVQSVFANANDVVGGFRVSSTTQTQPLFGGVSVIGSEIKVAGSVQLATTYQAKTTQAYVADAISATAGAAAATRTARLGNAANDIANLRNSSYADSVVVSSVAANIDLEAAHAALTYARDASRLLAATAQDQTTFASRSDFLRNLWDVTALGAPALGRSLADSNSDPFGPDNLVELGAFQAVSRSSDDAGFLTQFGIAAGTPLVSSRQPLLVLDGEQFGATGAQIQVIYYVGETDGSDLELNLPAAERHALMRASYTNLSVLSGPEAGLAFTANNESGRVQPGDSEYIGETFSGALFLEGDNAAWEISLNNFYAPQFVVLASWNVTAVPEPQAWLMLAAGLGLLGVWRRPRGAVRAG